MNQLHLGKHKKDKKCLALFSTLNMSTDPIKAHFEESLVRAATQASDETIKQASKEFLIGVTSSSIHTTSLGYHVL